MSNSALFSGPWHIGRIPGIYHISINMASYLFLLLKHALLSQWVSLSHFTDSLDNVNESVWSVSKLLTLMHSLQCIKLILETYCCTKLRPVLLTPFVYVVWEVKDPYLVCIVGVPFLPFMYQITIIAHEMIGFKAKKIKNLCLMINSFMCRSFSNYRLFKGHAPKKSAISRTVGVIHSTLELQIKRKIN